MDEDTEYPDGCIIWRIWITHSVSHLFLEAKLAGSCSVEKAE